MEAINVLIADDSAFIRKTISDLLLKKEQIDIIGQARDGKEAVDLAKQHHPDVILLDLLMPKMNGLDAFKLIMEDSPTPTIILSAVSPQNMDASIQALLMGAFDYVIKPGGLGSKDLPAFREELVAKVLLAANSQIKKVFRKEKEDVEKKPYLRQSIIDKAFEFGQYINRLEPIQEDISIENSSSLDIQPKISEMKKGTFTPVEKIEITSNKVEKIEIKPVKRDTLKEPPKKGVFKRNPLQNIQISKSNDKLKAAITPTRSSNIEEPKKTIQPTTLKVPFDLDIKPITNVLLRTKVVVVGASLGGPRTISLILRDLPDNFSCPIVVVQHLTEGFIQTFVNILNQTCKLLVKVAENGELLQPGVVYIAPGGNHTEISVKKNNPCIKIFKGSPVHFCMPSIDVLFFSAARVYKNKTLGVLLTGMGEDGVDGLGAIQKLRGKTIAESKETAVMYGMPKFAAERGVADKILPNYEINESMNNYSKQAN